MLTAANLFASAQTFVDQAMQHGQIDTFAQKLQATSSRFLVGQKDSTDDASFNPEWWAENGDLEFADYSEGADRPEETASTEEPAAPTPTPITIIEETVIVVVEDQPEPEPVDEYACEDCSPDDYDMDYDYDYDYDYDFYDEEPCETCYANGYEPPKKGDLGSIVFTSFWQVTIPMLVFNAVQQKAYKQHFGEYEPEDYDLDMETADWKTKQMEVWDDIQGMHILLWGPMFVLGSFALAGHFEEPAAWWLENMVSNIYLPFMLNETYKLAEYAYFEGEALNWLKVLLWSANNFLVFGFHMDSGSSAISYLRGIDQTAEEDFWPALFYKWGWMTHDDDETYAY